MLTQTQKFCIQPYSNGQLCNTPYCRIKSVDGVIERYNVFGRKIEYCPNCGADLALMENPLEYAPRAEVPGLTLSAPAFDNLQNLTQEEARAWFESVEPYPF